MDNSLSWLCAIHAKNYFFPRSIMYRLVFQLVVLSWGLARGSPQNRVQTMSLIRNKSQRNGFRSADTLRLSIQIVPMVCFRGCPSAPEDIAAKVLKAIKETAEAFLGSKVTKSVIAIPTSFGPAQRHPGPGASAQLPSKKVCWFCCGGLSSFSKWKA